jgi:hypothetical protein
MSDHNDTRLCGLPRSAAIGQHAQDSYDAFLKVYGIDGPPWPELTVVNQHLWWERSADFLQKLMPQPDDDSVFQQAVLIVRAEAARVLAFDPKVTP